MDDPADLDPVQMSRRSVRRKLIQATLVPHKPQEICVDDGLDDEKDSGGEEECRETEIKIRKKRTPAKTTPRKGVLKKPKKSNEKPSVNLTPKRNEVTHSERVSPSIPNLRLEAKMSAEENSRIFAGRELHPFFSIRTGSKKSQDTPALANNSCSVERQNREINYGPIHVLERTEDDILPLDWRHWIFCESVFSRKYDLKCSTESFFEGSVEPLNVCELPIIMHPCDALLFQKNESLVQRLIEKEDEHEIASTVPLIVVDEEGMPNHLIEDSKNSPVDKVCDISNSEMKSNTEEQSKFLHKRMRHYHHQSNDSLWTHKYRPEKAIDVCGNQEQVKFLSEWLQIWHEKNLQNNKDFTCGDGDDMEDNDCDYSRSISDLDGIDEEATLKNVLLVTGPAGSGKSAAIYACAKEQGFRVLEFSASDHRSGAVLKQMIGETLQSHQLKCYCNTCCQSYYLSYQMPNMHLIVRLYRAQVNASSLPDSSGVNRFGNGVVELIPLPDEDSQDITEILEVFAAETETVRNQGGAKPLILLEDVDIIFPEDRGFISVLQDIYETGKGPIILTSNDDNPLLPDQLKRLKVSFTQPSLKDLLSHMHVICAAEGVNVKPQLLQRFIKCCEGDVRKIIMHLQFWCQDIVSRGGKKVQQTYGSLLFDLDAFHLILPTIIPWSFPSLLSELVEKEINKSLFMTENNFSLNEASQEETDNKKSQQNVYLNKHRNLESKRVEMLNMNGSIHHGQDFLTQFDDFGEFSSTSSTPIAFSRMYPRRKLDLVISSDSEDDLPCKDYPLVGDKCVDAAIEPDLEVNEKSVSHFLISGNCLDPSSDEMLCVKAERMNGRYYLCSEPADEVRKSVEGLGAPESSFVPESVDNKPGLLAGATSWSHVTETMNISVNNGFSQNLSPVRVNNLEECLGFNKTSNMVENSCSLPEHFSIQGETSPYGPGEASMSAFQVMDECSRMHFNQSKFAEKHLSRVTANVVQESWKRLRVCHEDLRHNLALEKQEASQIVELAQRLSNLISDSDLLLSWCQHQCLDGKPMHSTGEVDTFNWCDDQLQMASTIAKHGFCFYARDVAAIAFTLDCENKMDIVSEMLGSTTDSMTLGKLVRQDMKKSRTSSAGINLERNQPQSDLMPDRENESRLDIVQSTVPPRLFLSSKGVAYFDYLSSLRHISKSESTRLSQGDDRTRRRRGRVARHYLSSGTLMLSPEDIRLLDRLKLP